MHLSVGSYDFDANSAKVAGVSKLRFNSASQQLSRITQLRVEGYLSASGQAALTSAQQALQVALTVPFPDIIFYQDDGTTESATVLKNEGSTSGVRIIDGPNFRGEQGAEYSTFRKFDFTAEAEYQVGPSNRLTSYHEQVELSGGGPMYIVAPAKRGGAQRQRLYEFTPYRVVQRGEAYGYLEYPPDPVILFPDRLREAPQITPIAPRRVGPVAYEEWGKAWNIMYESEFPLPALPNLWVG